MSPKESYGVLILAAGSSSRLGHPKQLLVYNGTTLLENSLKAALASQAEQVLVVLGAHSEKIKKETDFSTAQVVINKEWKEGMASSIRCGINFFNDNYPQIKGVIVMMCDQPGVTESVIQNLVITHQTSRKPIIASGYDDTFGPPVFFHQSYFKELLMLKNDVGARAVIRDHPDAVEIIPFPQGSFDIDTEEDFEKAVQSS